MNDVIYRDDPKGQGTGKMPKILEVFSRNVYGNFLTYPANVLADQFANLLRARTFSTSQLQQIEAIGFEIRSVADPRGVRP